MSEETQASCGFIVSACAAWLSHALELMPLLQFVAVIVAIVSGLFAIAVSAHKLYTAFKGRA